MTGFERANAGPSTALRSAQNDNFFSETRADLKRCEGWS
jgi:hypothetical protein